MISSAKRKGTHGETKVLEDRWRRQFVRLGLAICDMSLGHLKERTFNRQSAVYNSSDNTQFRSHYNLRRKETETQDVKQLTQVHRATKRQGQFHTQKFGF